MNKKIVIIAALLGIIAIILGAFGAHALKEKLDVQQLVTFETGVRYQMYHALFLLFVGVVPGLTDKIKNRIFYLIVFGVLFFSGSIYLLATQTLSGVNFKPIGFITPIGGLLLILGWAFLVGGLLSKKS